MIKRITHVAYVVEDLEKSLEFYCEKLGFDKMFSLDDDSGNPRLIYLKITEGQFIELFPADKSKNIDLDNNGSSTGYSHLCLAVDDIEEIAEDLKKKDISLESEPKQGADGNYQCWVTDPDGNRIELMQMMPDSLQNKYS